MMTSHEMTLLLSEPYHNNAILEIHPVQGNRLKTGAICSSSYVYCYGKCQRFRWGLDYQAGDGYGIKSVTCLLWRTQCRYGLLKSGDGVHRLVRISNYLTSKQRRHYLIYFCRSHARVGWYHRSWNPCDDIKMDTFRSGGRSNGNVNKVFNRCPLDSHSDRDRQHQPSIVPSTKPDRVRWRCFRQRLYQMEQEKKAAEVDSLKGDKRKFMGKPTAPMYLRLYNGKRPSYKLWK